MKTAPAVEDQSRGRVVGVTAGVSDSPVEDQGDTTTPTQTTLTTDPESPLRVQSPQTKVRINLDS